MNVTNRKLERILKESMQDPVTLADPVEIMWFRYCGVLFAYTVAKSREFADGATGSDAYATLLLEQFGDDADTDGPFRVVLQRSHRLKRDAISDAYDLYCDDLRRDGMVAPCGGRSYHVACTTCGADEGIPDPSGGCSAC